MCGTDLFVIRSFPPSSFIQVHIYLSVSLFLPNSFFLPLSIWFFSDFPWPQPHTPRLPRSHR